MNIDKIIDRAKENIQRALEDYAKHTEKTKILKDCTTEFIERLAEDSSYAKQDLRNLFSKSPAYNPDIDAIVINGTRTHNPNYTYIRTLIRQIFDGVWDKELNKAQEYLNAFKLFEEPNLNEKQKQISVEAINQLAPKAYSPTKKLSRVFKALCKAQGVADETAGSEFQKLYARFADEISSKKINQKIYMSINPAHFITMSNPKGDKRGETLISCHSFNSREYQYNNGCIGYARDKVSFIVFTVENPTKPETLNNRKTTRQIFAYKPDNGLLLQSRMYNTSGGQTRMTEESELYRDLVQREITTLENGINLWKTETFDPYDEDHTYLIRKHYDFGGYADWMQQDFEAKISFRKDMKNTHDPMIIGETGLCIMCADEIDEYLYCEACDEDTNTCYECDEIYRDGSTTTVYNSEHDRNVEICRSCLNELYTYCEDCGEYHPDENTTWLSYYETNICDNCLDNNYRYCDECKEYHLEENITWIDSSDMNVCEECLDKYYTKCSECNEYYVSEDLKRVLIMKNEYCLKYNSTCEHCISTMESIRFCETCEEYYDSKKIKQCHIHKTEEVKV